MHRRGRRRRHNSGCWSHNRWTFVRKFWRVKLFGRIAKISHHRQWPPIGKNLDSDVNTGEQSLKNGHLPNAVSIKEKRERERTLHSVPAQLAAEKKNSSSSNAWTLEQAKHFWKLIPKEVSAGREVFLSLFRSLADRFGECSQALECSSDLNYRKALRIWTDFLNRSVRPELFWAWKEREH